MRIVRRFLMLLLFVGVLVLGWKFASSNAQTVPVSYVAGEWPEVPLWAVMLGSFAASALVSALFSMFEVAKQGLVARRLRTTSTVGWWAYPGPPSDWPSRASRARPGSRFVGTRPSSRTRLRLPQIRPHPPAALCQGACG